MPTVHPREPSDISDLYRNEHMWHVLSRSSSSCNDYLRMHLAPFFHLTQMLKNNGLLQDTIHVPIEKQLVMFLNSIGHKSKNRVMLGDFIRSKKTISKYFKKVLGAMCVLRDSYMKQAPDETPPEVLSSTRWYPYFTVSKYSYVSRNYIVFEISFL